MTGNLTISEAAKFLTVSEATVRRLVAAGLIPFIRVSPRRIAIPAKGVKDYRGIAWQSGSRGGVGPSNFSKLEAEYFAACRKDAPRRKRKSSKRSSGANSLTLVR